MTSKANFRLFLTRVNFAEGRQWQRRSTAVFLATLCAISSLWSEDLTNGAIPATMDGGGTSDNPSLYTITPEGGLPYTRDWGSDGVLIGFSTSYNQLLVEQGSSGVSTSGWAIGYEASSNFNSVHVTGAGSRLSGDGIFVGYNGSDNTLTISEGAEVTSASVTVGLYGSRNSLVIESGGKLTSTGMNAVGVVGENQTVAISDEGSEWNYTDELYLISNSQFVVEAGGTVVGRNGFLSDGSTGRISGLSSSWSAFQMFVGANNPDGVGHSTLIIENGGSFRGEFFSIGGGYDDGNGNTVVVSGENSVLAVSDLSIGSSDGSDNSLAISDGALARIGEASAFLDIQADNFLRLDGGYLAIAGDQRDRLGSLIDGSWFQFWNGTEWVSGNRSDFQFDFFATNQAAQSFTQGLYDNLGGYTIITNAPEPSIMEFLLAAAALAGCHRRKS